MNENFSDGAGRREKGKRGGGSGSQAVTVSVHQPGCSCAVQGERKRHQAQEWLGKKHEFSKIGLCSPLPLLS